MRYAAQWAVVIDWTQTCQALDAECHKAQRAAEALNNTQVQLEKLFGRLIRLKLVIILMLNITQLKVLQKLFNSLSHVELDFTQTSKVLKLLSRLKLDGIYLMSIMQLMYFWDISLQICFRVLKFSGRE